jgi:hypothetical protein
VSILNASNPAVLRANCGISVFNGCFSTLFFESLNGVSRSDVLVVFGRLDGVFLPVWGICVLDKNT